MGEKEIKPAVAGGLSVATPSPTPAQAGGGHTTERPGTGGTGTPPKGGPTKQPPAGSGTKKPYHFEDHYDDDYRVTVDEGSPAVLTHPDGTTATWDSASEKWLDADGKAMSDDWSGGHRPTKYETKVERGGS